MSKTDWAVLGLNALVALMAIVGFMAQDTDPMSIGLALAILATTVNSALLIRRGERRPEAPRQPEREGFDAHQLLDIDARLEALERAEARTLRALVDQGVVRGPAPEAGDVQRARTSQPLLNGR